MDQPNVQQNSEPAPAPQSTKSNKSKLLIIVIVLVVVLYGLQSLFSPERFVERAIEKSTGGSVDIDFDENGSYRIQGENGESYSATAGENVSLPDNWPDSVSIVPGAKISYAGSMNNGDTGEGLSVVYTTSKSAPEVGEFYKSELQSNGWSIEGTIATGDGSMITAKQGTDKTLAVYIGATDGETTVNITVQIMAEPI